MIFEGNDEFKESVKIINLLDDGKFALLLNRIGQFLGTGTSHKPFTLIEEEKLESSLQINKAQVQNLLDGIIKIFQVCAYHIIKPSFLSEKLEEALSMSSRKAEIFVQAWTNYAKNIVDTYKQKPFFPQLNHLSYSISVDSSSDFSSKERIPKAQLQLGLMSPNPRNPKKEINLEFTGEQLYNFYAKIEQIQEQLDAFR